MADVTRNVPNALPVATKQEFVVATRSKPRLCERAPEHTASQHRERQSASLKHRAPRIAWITFQSNN